MISRYINSTDRDALVNEQRQVLSRAIDYIIDVNCSYRAAVQLLDEHGIQHPLTGDWTCDQMREILTDLNDFRRMI